MFNAAFWWALAGIILMILEFVIPGLILFFFGLGALVVALCAWLIPSLSLTLQLTIFIVASLASLFALRRWLKTIFTGGTSAESDDAFSETLAGEEGTVTEPIAPGIPGKVKLHGTDWRAESAEELEVGCHIVVKNQKSLTLMVKAK